MRALTALAILAVSFLGERAATAAFVDASTVTSVIVEAPLYDTRLATSNGCDPAGCQGSLTRDGDETSLGSRWSCQPALGTSGSTCSIIYTLDDSLQIYGLNIAMYKGDSRTRTMDVYVDGLQADTWTTSGTTTDFETFKLGFYYTSSTSSYTYVHPGVPAKTIELRGVLEDSEWLSILEVEILVDDGTVDSSDDDDTEVVVVEAGVLGSVTTAASLYDTRLSAANGCDPAGCTAALTRDDDLSPSSRWSCMPNLGGECTISYDLGTVREIIELRVAMYKGNERQRTAEVYVDGVLFTTWTSLGTTTALESIDLWGTSGEMIEIVGVLEDSEWLSIVEVEIMVVSDGTTMPPSPVVDPTPAPTSMPTKHPTMAPTPMGPTPAPTTPEPDGDLMPVGLIPLATASPASDLEMYYVKDGDLSTSWTCFASTQEHELPEYLPFFACTITFDLFSFRHIKEVKIAMPDGAERAIGIRITGRTSGWDDESFVSISGTVDQYVMSSGQTDGLESYEFDFFTDEIAISAVFAGTSSDESFSVSEVEFVEEVFNDQVPVVGFFPSTDVGDGRWSMLDAFEWISDSPEVVGETLTFYLNNYADVTAVELRFPVGDSYKFDLELYNDAVDSSDDLFATVSGLESSADEARWQTFDVSAGAGGQYVTMIKIVMQGTGSGEPGFSLLDGRIIGTAIENPTGILYVGSARVEDWDSKRYPDFVAAGTGDQSAIMAAICAVKKTSFDGVDCVGEEDETATGKIMVPMGDYFVDGNIFMKSGVYLRGWFSSDDAPGLTRVFLEEGAGGKTDVDAILVMDNIADAIVEDIWIRGLYDPETDSETPVVSGLGTTGISVVNSRNVTCKDMEARYADGDAVVVRNSNSINIDAGNYDYDYFALDIGHSRGTGLLVDSSDSVYVRRHDIEMNGVAGIHITGSNNFTFEGPRGYDSGSSGQAYVGKSEGLQPVQVVIDSSTLVTFTDIGVFSDFEPAITVSADSSGVTFDSCSFYSIDSGMCVIQADDTSVVATGGDDELTLVGNCFLKV